MRLTSARDLGLYVRSERRRQGLTQTALSEAADVSRRWLSDLESGKATAEVGLVFKVLASLGLVLEASPETPREIDLDEILTSYQRDRGKDRV